MHLRASADGIKDSQPHYSHHTCKRRTNVVPPAGRGSVGLSADPSHTQTGENSSVVDGISSVGFQLTPPHWHTVPPPQWYKIGPPFRAGADGPGARAFRKCEGRRCSLVRLSPEFCIGSVRRAARGPSWLLANSGARPDGTANPYPTPPSQVRSSSPGALHDRFGSKCDKLALSMLSAYQPIATTQRAFRIGSFVPMRDATNVWREAASPERPPALKTKRPSRESARDFHGARSCARLLKAAATPQQEGLL